MGLDMFLFRKDISEAAYWRKANAIHGWFDSQQEGGLDNCETLTLDVRKLKELRDLCDELLVDKSEDKAMELLPPTAGFFFGSSEIDEWYWDNIQETSTKLTEVINNSTEDQLFEYHAWW